MFLTIFTFITAFSIEALGTLVSVIGLSALFGNNPIIIAFAVALDAGKIVVVTLLYKHWAVLPKLMRAYALIAAFITMIVTSAGAAGYLSGEFQKAITGAQESSLKVDVLKQQQAKYEERKRQIDTQIASLPEKTTVNQRIRMMSAFKAEQQDLQAKINQIDQELPKLQVDQISVNAKAGPIIAISKAFNIPVEQAVSYVILTLIFVFDPLAVFLIIAGNFLLERVRSQKSAAQVSPRLEEPVKMPEPVMPKLVDDQPVSVAPPAFVEPEPVELTPIEEPAQEEPQVLEERVEEPPVEEPAEEPVEEPAPEEPPAEEPVEEPVEETPAPEDNHPQRDLITLTSLGLAPEDQHTSTSLSDVMPDPHTHVEVTGQHGGFRAESYKAASIS